MTQAHDSLVQHQFGPAAADYVAQLGATLDRIAHDADASGLAHHELWSYRVADGRVLPLRYESSSDIQLWNLTDLAVQFTVRNAERCASRASARPESHR